MIDIRNHIKVGIVKSAEEFEGIYNVINDVFNIEQNVIELENSGSNANSDEWDKFSINLFVSCQGVIVATGRLIKYNSEVGFRVSSSLNVGDYINNLHDAIEINGLAVKQHYRKQNIGTFLHYIRIMLAKKLGYKYIIASTAFSGSSHLKNMGFEIACESFLYKHYKINNESTFLIFDLKDPASNKKMEQYFDQKLGDLKKMGSEALNSLEI